MEVIPAPELPARKVFKRPRLRRIGVALGAALAASAFTAAMGVFLPMGAMPAGWLGFIAFMCGLAFVMMFLLTYHVDYSEPTVTLEEMWFRKRLEQACKRDARVAQLNADYLLLDAAADSLYKELGKDGFSKLKDRDIIDRAVEQARKKTID